MKDTVGRVGRTHQLIEALGRARKHVRKVSGGQTNTLGLSRRSRSIDDGDDIAVLQRIRCIRRPELRRGLA